MRPKQQQSTSSLSNNYNRIYLSPYAKICLPMSSDATICNEKPDSEPHVTAAIMKKRDSDFMKENFIVSLQLSWLEF